ncbi:MAG: laccase domain-containing protein [Citromicrobium sp.]|nr:MAG: laccase domain-containing protein [Citromicrobium sp.]
MADIITAGVLSGLPHGFSGREGLEAQDIMPGAPLVRLKQIHSADVVIMREGVVTADCAPVLLADQAAGIVGAAHAGWRGARAGVIENTVQAMESLGARRGSIAAAIGPTIAQCSYEVDPEFRARFDAEDETFFQPGKGDRLQFDLPSYVAHRLRSASVTRVEDLALDTYADATRFCSYRRATHLGEPTDGRQLSVIALP